MGIRMCSALFRQSLQAAIFASLILGTAPRELSASSWGSCALGSYYCGQEGCWNLGHGFPISGYDVPECQYDPEETDCYVCLYSQPSVVPYGVCSERPNPEDGLVCDQCRVGSYPGALPVCPYSP